MVSRAMAIVLGGFHLGGLANEKIAEIVQALQEMGVKTVSPCHCSGDAARRLFKDAWGDDCILAGVGATLEAGNPRRTEDGRPSR